MFVILPLILLGLLVVVGMAVIGIYNNLVTQRNRIENAFSQIDVQLKRRADLIPNLVETVKGYAAHEKETLERVIQARNQLVQAGGIEAAQAQADNLLTGALKSVFALAESYPDLKANQNFMMLQEELTGTESKVAYARQFYNDSVLQYDNALGVFLQHHRGDVQLPAEAHFETAPRRPRAREGQVLAMSAPRCRPARPRSARAPSPRAAPSVGTRSAPTGATTSSCWRRSGF
jgi:LemA protein